LEGKVYKILLKTFNKEDVVVNKKYEELRNPITNRKLEFDFRCLGSNLVIEVQGKHHYKRSKYAKTNRLLAEQQARDNIKRQYCILNGLRLIEITKLTLDQLPLLISEVSYYPDRYFAVNSGIERILRTIERNFLTPINYHSTVVISDGTYSINCFAYCPVTKLPLWYPSRFLFEIDHGYYVAESKKIKFKLS